MCINDRGILKAMAAYSGFKEEDYDEVFIILDKMDKIGARGVADELLEMGYDREKAESGTSYSSSYSQPAPDILLPGRLSQGREP